MASTGNTPGARFQGESWIDTSGNFWLFGGWGSDSTGTTGLLNDLWEYSPSANTWMWVSGGDTLPPRNTGLFQASAGVYGTQGTASASNVPGGRYIAAAWADASGNFWLFGGVGADATDTDGLLNDVWEYSPSANTWTWMGGSTTVYAPAVYGTEGVASASNTPGARYMMLYWTDATHNLWLFGGGGGSYEDGDPNAFNYVDLWTTGSAGTASPRAATPAFSVAGGNYSSAQSVNLSDTTPNATIYYTADGTTPTTNPSSFAETNTCGSSLAAGLNCSISITFSPSAAASFTATLSVADNASGSPQTITLNGTGTASAATFSLSSLTSTGTVSPTTAATYSLTVTPQNGSFTSPISLTASGVPAGYEASFNPRSVTPGNSPAAATLTISKSPIAMIERTLPFAAPAFALIGFFFLPARLRKRFLALVVLFAASLGVLSASGCAGGFGLPTTTFNVTITASGGGVTQTTTVQLTVRQSGDMMRIQTRITLVLFFAEALLAASTLHPQTASGATRENVALPEIAADFSYFNSNAPVGGCGCFGVYGGSLTLAFPIARGPVAIVGDITSGSSTSIAPNNYHLTLSTFTAGARYSPNLRWGRYHPFAQATAGFAHVSQDLVDGSGASVPNATATFAADLGGGIDLDLNRRFRLRLAQAGYLLTTFDNGSNNRQNNLRLSAGFVFRY